jgi:hypothetical protein
MVAIHPPFLGTELKKKKQRKYRTNLIVDTLALIIRLVLDIVRIETTK